MFSATKTSERKQTAQEKRADWTLAVVFLFSTVVRKMTEMVKLVWNNTNNVRAHNSHTVHKSDSKCLRTDTLRLRNVVKTCIHLNSI